ncbi:DDB1- and CUL4-associated factor 13 [Sabethes cyaneus]|uniref:DDB1- and CUL4-associated factor 13 n=1 Tax=Sabethes cyaneus TaxID=53552 RepID=UPI00237E8486|nr:DDB1- and CUL4-associated factor 13 [Sabethes cyaneus]
MKVKVISRNPDNYLRETKRDIHRVFRNYDSALHPFEEAREYVRALNATKLERVFAKPFVGSFGGHRDGVSVLGKHPKSLSLLLSGSYDGEVKLWDVANRTCLQSIQAHDGYVRGITFSNDGSRFFTIGDDKCIKMWNSNVDEDIEENPEPLNTILGKTVITSISHNYEEPMFATCGETCHIWNETRNSPIKSLQWGVDTLYDVKYNPVETSLLAACCSDRGIIFYDQREIKPLRKIVMTLRPNQLAWNPMQAYYFTVASEDYNLYTFDTRRLKNPLKIHGGHVSAVTCVDYAPTGREFVAGSYDKTIRIFDSHKANSRDVYHTKRMQHVTSVGWSLDNKYIFSGSDEMNVRIWKARAAEKLGALQPRERQAFKYNEALKEKFAAHPQIRRIAQHRHVPKVVYKERQKLQTVKQKIKRKEENVRQNSKPGKVPYVAETKKKVLREEK